MLRRVAEILWARVCVKIQRYKPFAFTEQGVAMFTPLNAWPIQPGLSKDKNEQLMIFLVNFTSILVLTQNGIYRRILRISIR